MIQKHNRLLILGQNLKVKKGQKVKDCFFVDNQYSVILENPWTA